MIYVIAFLTAPVKLICIPFHLAFLCPPIYFVCYNIFRHNSALDVFSKYVCRNILPHTALYITLLHTGLAVEGSEKDGECSIKIIKQTGKVAALSKLVDG